MKSKLMWLAVPTMILIAGCGGGSAVTTECSWVKPILPDSGFDERWTRAEKEQVASHNEAGEENCGW